MLNISLYRQICDCSKPSVVVFCRRCFSGIPKNGILAIRALVHRTPDDVVKARVGVGGDKERG